MMSTTVLWLCLLQTLIWATVNSLPPSCNTLDHAVYVDSQETVDFILLELDNVCSDPDNDPLTYSISEGNDDGLFKIAGSQVQLAKAIPAQMRFRYLLKINVDDGTPGTVVDLYFTVTINFNNNVNDPILDVLPTINLPESAQIGTLITACTVSDADEPKNTLSGVTRVGISNPYGAVGRKFILDSVSCELFVNTVLDYEKIKSYNLVIEAWDLDPITPRRVNKSITINILDENDNKPTCTAYEVLEAITLSATVGQQIFKADCSDVDSGANGQITYSMDASNTAPATNLFEVESTTGILKVKSTITDANIPFYEVVINVKDGGAVSQETKVLVRVVVTDASGPEPTTFDRRILYPAIPDDVAPLSTIGRTPPPRTDPLSIPSCVRNAVTVVMPEDQLANTELYDLECSDPDGQNLEYVIVKGDVYSSFEVINGKFRLRKVINGDFTSKRSIFINVTNPFELWTSVVVAVYITNSNDNDPVIKDLPASIQVREDQPIGTIVNSCSVNEKDSKQSLPPGGQTRVGWINSDPDTQYWFLDSVTCDLYVNTPLDYETTKTYTLLIGAWDLDPSAPRTVTGTMTVSILDANDNPPICPATYDVSVPEDASIGSVLQTVVCTDADSEDNGKVYFKLDDANEAIVKSTFTIDGTSGEVQVQAGLDFEAKTSYDVIVVAYDGGLPLSLSSTSTVRVTVTDVADGGATGQNTSTPNYTFKPTVGITLVGNAPVAFEFLCNFNLDNKPLWYLVNWYVNGNKIYTTPRVSSSFDVLDGTKLTEAKMVEKGVTTVGFDISCEFRASFADDSNLGDKSTSDSEFVGIKVLTKTVTVAQGEEGVIQVQATAPIGCNGATCNFPLYTFLQKNGFDCAVSQASVPCGVNIDTGNYANVYDIKIKGGITFQYGRSGSSSTLKLRSGATYADHPMWANYELDDVTVTVTQDTTLIEGSKCAAFVDPRVVTFDKGLLDLQEVGVYTLYSHLPTKSEIQIESYQCDAATGAHCVCGVALRTGRSVFKLYRCGSNYTDIQFSLCDDDHLKVEKLERFYQVYFPTGTRATIFMRPLNMNIFIYPSVMDVNVAKGLCGKLSGDPNDDLVKRDGTTSTDPLTRALFEPVPDFFDSWKVSSPVVNLFDVEAGVNDGGLSTLDGSTFVYDPADYSCSPITNALLGGTGSVTNAACSIFTDVSRIQSDAASVGFSTVGRKPECKTNQKRRRRSVRAQKKPLNLAEEAHFREKRSVWKNGWTEESATTFCRDLFNQSSMVTLCKDLSLVDITSSQIACFQDIKLSGSADYSLDTMSAIRSQCIHEVSADDSFKIPDQPGEKPKFESILEVACPGECTQQGVCVDGKCQCNEGFGAIDCSVDITDSPLLVTLENEGYCDVRDQDCSQISAFGETFVAGQNMRCKTTYFELITGVEGMVMKEEKQHVPFLESISEAVCTFPPLPVRDVPDSSVVAYGYKISLTNDGQAYSDPNYMAIFNSECQSCVIYSNGVNCSIQSGYCVADGNCYANGTAHKDNECYTCQSGVWAIRGDEVCIGAPEDEDDMLWIIGVVLGILCVIILAGVLYFLVNRKKNKISLSQTQLNPGPSRKFSKTNLNT